MPPQSQHNLPPLVVLSANNCWNIAHFRGGLLAGLAEAGYRVAILASVDQTTDALRARGIEVRAIPITRSGVNPLTDAWLVIRYLRALLSLRPAAYCSFTIKPNVYGSLAARMAGVPVINNVTGIGTPLISKGLVWAVAEQLYRLAFRGAHTVFFHNTADLDLMVERGIVPRDRARVIPGSGINLEYFKPESAVRDDFDGSRTFLFIGRLILHKGVREYIEAARSLKRKLPNTRFRLLGELDPGNPTSVSKDELQSWVDEGVVEHVIERGDVRPLVRDATAVVLPSYREGLSRALLEGAAMGKPLVGTDVPGSRELVHEGVTGALCAPRDAESLAAAMERIAVAPLQKIARLGANARAMVECGYSEERVVRAYRDVLDRIGAGAR